MTHLHHVPINVTPATYHLIHHLYGVITMILITYLASFTPSRLRLQLTAPDPVELHDWNVTKEQYTTAVLSALKLQDIQQ